MSGPHLSSSMGSGASEVRSPSCAAAVSPAQRLHFFQEETKNNMTLGYRHLEHPFLSSCDLGILLSNLRLTFPYGRDHMTFFCLSQETRMELIEVKECPKGAKYQRKISSPFLGL